MYKIMLKRINCLGDLFMNFVKKTCFFKHPSSPGLTRKFIFKFLRNILLPVLVLCGIWVGLLSYYFVENGIHAQKVFLENSMAQLESTASMDNVFTALQNSSDLVNYLDFYTTKADMLYVLVKSVRNFHKNLQNTISSIETIRIYSNKPQLLYTDPFYPMDSVPLDDNFLAQAMDIRNLEPIWYIVPQKNADDSFGTPAFYTYKKLYSTNYRYPIGLIEIQIHPAIVESLFSQFDDSAGFYQAKIYAWQNQSLVYSNDSGHFPASPDTQTAWQLDWIHNHYQYSIYLPEMRLTLAVSGQILGLLHMPSGFPVYLVIILVIILTCSLFSFFMDITDLSTQITDFASHLAHSAPDDLTAYLPSETTSVKKFTRIWKIFPGIRHHEYDELRKLILTYNKMIHENSVLITKMQQMELLNQKARYQALQAQIHPHFLFGTLENIRMMALQKNDLEVSDMIFSLSSIIRQSMTIRPEGNTLEEELTLVRHYLSLQKYRFGERLDYSFDVDQELLSLKVPSFCLQPITENAIYYGLSRTFAQCCILVSAHFSPHGICICISNNGIPISPRRLNEVNGLLSGQLRPADFKGSGNGIALYNIKERMQLFWNEKSSLRLVYDAPYTKTILEIEKTNFAAFPKEDTHAFDSDR